jgi:hypothetical protein
MPLGGPYNTITLAVNTPVQVTAPNNGHWYFNFINAAGGKLYISDQPTVGANATSFLLPNGLSSPAFMVSGNNLWISSDTAGPVSLYCASMTPYSH